MMIQGHIIDLHNVTDVRGCTECDCKATHAHLSLEQRWPIFDGIAYSGGLECCHSSFDTSGAKCDVSAHAQHEYFFEFTIAYTEYDPQTPTKSLDVPRRPTRASTLRPAPSAWAGVSSTHLRQVTG